MTFEQCPFITHIAPNWYLWCSFRFYRIVLLVVATPFTIVNLGEWLDLLYGTNGSKLDRILRIYLTVQLVTAVARSWAIGLKSNELKALFQEVEQIYTEFDTSSDSHIRSIVKRYTTITGFLCRLNFVSALITVISFNIRPLLTKKRDHPFPMYFPLMDYRATPYFQLLYVLTTYVSYVGYIAYCSVGNVFLCLVTFGIVRIKVLQHELRNLSSKPKMEDEKLQKCVMAHIEILGYVRKLNTALTYLALFEFLCFSVLFCTVLYLLATGSSQTERMLIIGYLIMNLTQSYEIYYFANKLREESFLLNYAVYENPWYTYSIKVQKNIWMFSMCSEKPMEIMIGNIGPMSLGTFQSILNASYSYFNLLRSGERRNLN